LAIREPIGRYVDALNHRDWALYETTLTDSPAFHL
jgi:hypothetical protein